MAKKKTNKEPKLSKAFSDLEVIVKEFEEGEVDLENSIEKFKKGLELSKYLKKRLNKLENEINEIKDDFDINEKTNTKKKSSKKKKNTDSQEEIPF